MSCLCIPILMVVNRNNKLAVQIWPLGLVWVVSLPTRTIVVTRTLVDAAKAALSCK